MAEVARIERYGFVGVTVDAFDSSTLLTQIGRLIDRGERCVIAHHNLHSVYLVRRDSRMVEYFNRAHYTIADGIGPILLGRAKGQPLNKTHRITCVDYIPLLFGEAERNGWSMFYLGGEPEVLERGLARIRDRWPGLQISGHHGYFDLDDPAANHAIVEKINGSKPNLLLVGMGMPRQEHWILQHGDRAKANVVLATGGFMDYFAGAIPTPPRRFAGHGMEWIFRLRDEPRRLWKRYLLEPWLLAWILVSDAGRKAITRLGSKLRRGHG